jgi:CDP-diglyceride synthetase
MIGGFFAALFMGHVYILVIITAVQIVSFKEVIAIANVPSRARDLQSTKSLNWYWLATTMYFLYGESVVYYLKHIVLVDKVLLPLATHHRFISFILYVFGGYFRVLHRLTVLTLPSQALCSSSARSRRATSNSSSRSLPGRTWPCSSSSCRRTSS